MADHTATRPPCMGLKFPYRAQGPRILWVHP
ncbi:predicted protein [Sclerotinia sclerotiorum 1980 UF-70]|uniref:Uncharacterized protein n=1 Tax=Sclerotinia sclerotiorum (strain ATCC 18683 / 1980 / Ss-1) TaxID=665079 RepID=A7EI06_SCLS1|nr:predicted protein [Sclerotinia sclerotiorum 1980 UF-70]EDO02472.1 predicted protein [Sclerotinia sclerotiorum 1980 UF-70]